MKINHVAIAVENVEDAAKAYQDALDIKSVEFETVESEGVKVAILHLENANIELMEPTNDSSPIRKFLERRGSGLHHIALEVDNIYNAIEYLEDNNIKVIYNTPQKGADNKLITFIHPRYTPGVLIELCQLA